MPRRRLRLLPAQLAIRDVKNVAGEEDIWILPLLAQGLVLRVIPDGLPLDAVALRDVREAITLLDAVARHSLDPPRAPFVILSPRSAPAPHLLIEVRERDLARPGVDALDARRASI